MASPQWKNFQPSTQDPASPHCHRSPSFNRTSNDERNSNSSSPGGVTRETGIVEKLLKSNPQGHGPSKHSYGFIQCCERQARLFFHFSQYSGNIEHLKLGDAVEFEMTYDRRTGKPIASSVSKITSEVGEVMSEERVSGFVTTEIKDNTEGRVAYESRGECFFLPYSIDDIEGNSELHPPDKVTFRIATDKNTGNLRARDILLEKPPPPRYQGVICSLKETFGFIERADMVKEIFFHSSECKGFKNLALGDDVEFSVQTRNNKEVAVNIVTLPEGTVVFEDISPDLMYGEISEALEKSRSRTSDAMPGKIQVQMGEDVVYFPFGERDLKAEYTLQAGDWVQFNVATDRRDNLQRATNIELLDNGFNFEKEKRVQGVVTAIRETFGFLTYSEREDRVYFRKGELLDKDKTIQLNDEVEFTMIKVSTDLEDALSPPRYLAIRLKLLPPGTVDTNSTNGAFIPDDNFFIGTVEKEAHSRWFQDSPQKGNKKDAEENDDESSQTGVIVFSKKERAYYSNADCDQRTYPRTGDRVEFFLTYKNGKKCAIHIKVVSKVKNGFRYTHRGFVAALKDTFGFIETEDHDKEVFFHYSVFDGNASSLEVGQEVEYGVTHKGNKLSAECVRKLTSSSIPKEEIQPEILNGVVLHPLRCFNPEQESYPGKIRLAPQAENMEEEDLPEYEFGITSLDNKHEFLQKGDVVQFQIGVTKKGKERAVNIKAIRTRIQAIVDTIKGNFGFLCYEAEEGKKLFFHMSEVKGDGTVQPGDKVEFIVVHHQRTGKYSACGVVKIGDSQPMQRPERLNRLRTISSEGGGPKIILIRQPKGPDGSTGFKLLRPVQENGVHDSMNGQLDPIQDLTCSVNNELRLNTLEPNPIVCSEG